MDSWLKGASQALQQTSETIPFGLENLENQRMGFELQYDGLQRGFDLNYPHFDAPASLSAAE